MTAEKRQRVVNKSNGTEIVNCVRVCVCEEERDNFAQRFM